MRYGNSRPDSKKTITKKIKKNNEILNSIENIDLNEISEVKRKFLEHNLDSALNEIIESEERLENGDYSLKPFKRRKNISLEKLKVLVLDYIEEVLNNEQRLLKHISKEEISRKYEVKEHLVEQVFHILNREGILSQRKSNYAHDTNRNPMFDGIESGWAEDTYSILKK